MKVQFSMLDSRNADEQQSLTFCSSQVDELLKLPAWAVHDCHLLCTCAQPHSAVALSPVHSG